MLPGSLQILFQTNFLRNYFLLILSFFLFLPAFSKSPDKISKAFNRNSVNSVEEVSGITMSANYCLPAAGGKIRITATSSANLKNWKWSNGQNGTNTHTTSFIDVDLAGTYTVTATNATGSVLTGSIKIAQELVINRDFELGDVGFVSDYKSILATIQQGLQPEKTYTVTNNPNFSHSYFWGKDFTYADGTGKFMLINGYEGGIVWKQEVNVTPNTVYYFSAQAVSLNDVSPFANLRFRVNNVQVGSNTGPLPSKLPNNNPGNWIKFYGSWNSGIATKAIIEIIDLENAAGGNDFGLDDISFATLSPFLNLTSAPGTDNQAAFCIGGSIKPISYEIGSNGEIPKPIGLPKGITTSWDGRNLTISGTPTETGTFNYSITTGCVPMVKTGRIIIDQLSKPGNFASQIISVCQNSTATVSLSNFTGSVSNWVTSSDKGKTWRNIGASGSVISLPDVQNAVLLKATVKNNSCAAVETPIVKVGVKNLWTGEESNEFGNAKNWSDEAVPSTGGSCPTVIIPPATNFPLISNSRLNITNLQINQNSSLKISGSGVLGIGGSITNLGILDVTNGMIDFNGTSPQEFSGSLIQDRTIKNIRISNSQGLRISNKPGDTLNITGELSFGLANASLNTGDNITLKSTRNGTANVGIVDDGNIITGKFIVERYLNLGTDKSLGQHRKSWQLLSTPVGGQSLREAWQEAAVSDGKTPLGNRQNGYGTLLTTGYNNVPANGFDLYTAPGPSIKTFNSETGGYDKGPINVFQDIYNPKGYMILVRGDRRVFTSNAAANPTVLRSKGYITTGNTKEILVKKGTWESIGNPYPSQIDLRKIKLSGGVDDVFFVWDPKLTGAYGLGGWQTLKLLGDNYRAIPGEGSYGSDPVNFLESGQAFLVQATHSDGTVSFNENVKTVESAVIMRGAGKKEPLSLLSTSLYGINNGETFLADGNLVIFGEEFSNDIDGKDARKMSNTSENFGIRSHGKDLIIESRKNIENEDTIFFRLSGLMIQNYQLKISAENITFPGITAWLEDTYLQNSTLVKIDDTTVVDFAVTNIAGSYSPDRFRIIFKAPASPLPVTFTGIKAAVKEDGILVQWQVENEDNIKHYELERSTNGISFIKIATVAAKNISSGNYEWYDEEVLEGNYYYRVKSIDQNGKKSVTNITKAFFGKIAGTIRVYPNPVINGILTVQINHLPKGIYKMRLVNSAGQEIFSKTIQYSGINHSEKITWNDHFPRGIYQVEITDPDGKVQVIKVIY